MEITRFHERWDQQGVARPTGKEKCIFKILLSLQYQNRSQPQNCEICRADHFPRCYCFSVQGHKINLLGEIEKPVLSPNKKLTQNRCRCEINIQSKPHCRCLITQKLHCLTFCLRVIICMFRDVTTFLDCPFEVGHNEASSSPSHTWDRWHQIKQKAKSLASHLTGLRAQDGTPRHIWLFFWASFQEVRIDVHLKKILKRHVKLLSSLALCNIFFQTPASLLRMSSETDWPSLITCQRSPLKTNLGCAVAECKMTNTSSCDHCWFIKLYQGQGGSQTTLPLIEYWQSWDCSWSPWAQWTEDTLSRNCVVILLCRLKAIGKVQQIHF